MVSPTTMAATMFNATLGDTGDVGLEGGSMMLMAIGASPLAEESIRLSIKL